MDNSLGDKINCCFCDKDLSPNSEGTSARPIKYKCPACGRIYCSAVCFTSHKDIFECSGIRDRTPYVHLASYDQKQFLDDYFFLEAVNNKIEYAQKVLKVTKRPSNCISKKKRVRKIKRKTTVQSTQVAESRQIE